MLKTPTRIFLIGPMGSGKTAVGRQLARMLNLKFYDSDVEVEQRTGVDIPYIFEREGESGFRQREREVIEALTALDGVVVATGGGAVLLPENRECLRTRGCSVYLQTSVAQQVERTRHSHHRPLLNTPNPEAKLRELMSVREPLYKATAHIIVPTDGRHVRGVAEDIVQRLAQELPA